MSRLNSPLITCPHCVSFTVALVICKLKRILKGFTSAAQRVFFDDANNATCKSRVGFNGLPYSVTRWHFRAAGMSGLFSASPVNVQEAHEYMRAIQQCSTDLYRTAVTSSYCVSYRRLAINCHIIIVILLYCLLFPGTIYILLYPPFGNS